MLDIDDILQSDAYDDDESKHKPACCPPMSLGIKPVPPPPPLQRKVDLSTMKAHKVVTPPKESCYNLPIIFPALSESNLKSRVETQIRVTIDLAHPSSSPNPGVYDRVGSWKYLKLPHGTATKRRSRKQGRIDPDPQDILYLTFSVNCATEPYNRVVSCTSCQAREAKRVAKKIAARVRPPAPSDSEGDDNPTNPNDPSSSAPKLKHEDPSSIIQFNCSPLIDFSAGTAVLPLRITCYCRHHREKVGFHVNLTLVDFMGRAVGSGTTKPIMITDDHKSGNQAKSLQAQPLAFPTHIDWQTPSPPATTAPSKRKTGKNSTAAAKKERAKPYDSSAKPNHHASSSRETSVFLSNAPSPDTSVSSPSAPSPASSHNPDPQDQDHEMSTPLDSSSSPSAFSSQISVASPPSLDLSALSYNYGYTSPQHSQDSLSESSPDGLITPTDLGPTPFLDLDVSMLNDTASDTDLFPTNPTNLLPFLSLLSNLPHNPNSTALPPPPPPTIHRLIPSCGPTHGGIEVTVLGANFHMTLVNELTCVFGGVEATSTTRWSDNALVCVLPPRAQAGVVEVEVRVRGEEKQPIVQSPPPQPTLFTYSDESDRALMELALQVVGLKMTGKIEDAKNVAMRIVGGDTSNNSSSTTVSSTGGAVTNTLFTATSDFEKLVLDFLSMLDVDVHATASTHPKTTQEALRHVTSSGQSLLHLAAYVGYPKLLQFLTDRWEGEGELDMRDKNGWTALHFACMRYGHDTEDKERMTSCVNILLRAGADREVVDASGRTAEEVGGDEVAELITELSIGNVVATNHVLEGREPQVEEDEDEWWGDAEDDDVEDSETVRDKPRKRRQMRRSTRREKQKEPSTSTSEPSIEPAVDKEKEAEAEKEIKELGLDEKRALSFIDMLYRTMGQLPGAAALPNIPVGLPNLPIPALVFPVMLPAIFGEKQWTTLWEKWILWQQGRQAEEEAPPEYTPRVDPQKEQVPNVELPSASASTSRIEQLPEVEGPQTSRNASSKLAASGMYDTTNVTEQDLSAYRYEKKEKRGAKGDRMLILFWIPILIISLIWACHAGLQFAMRTAGTPIGWGFKKVVAGH